MSLKIYGIKNCDTMKKAFTWLEDHGIDYTFHDYKKLGIDQATIKSWLKIKPIDLLINSKGPTYKKLSEEDKLACQKPATALPVMMQFTSTIKRPLIEFNGDIILGFNPELYQETFLK
ncbi:MAG: arsenate reductase [Bacteroidetes bacterium B1(2017)]|nr:MAG: arsenate reductase [Bacteroidetes bacterium B1(2017)]